MKTEDGNVAIVTAMVALTLFAIAATTVDVGAMMVRHSGLQTGADAAAIAIARRCADAVVTGAVTCTTTAGDAFISGNAPGATSVTSLRSSWAGRAGRVTVTTTGTQSSPFTAVINRGATQSVQATATARWGPLTADDAVFPMAICKGALPALNEPFVLVVDPASPPTAGPCAGAATEQPFGWTAPDDPDLCTTKISLLPSTYLPVSSAANSPTSDGCRLAIDELHNDIDKTAVCHETPHETLHCHGSATSADRQRDVVVYDAARGAPDGRPSYSLISVEFIGARMAGRTSHSAGGWSGECAAGAYDPATVNDLQCIRGIVRANVPETDGPIVDPTLASLPGIADSTVLDVRLVD